MLMIGSSSFSPGTSTQFISMAPGSPGEHGVNRSSTILPLFKGHSPRTCNNISRTATQHTNISNPIPSSLIWYDRIQLVQALRDLQTSIIRNNIIPSCSRHLHKCRLNSAIYPFEVCSTLNFTHRFHKSIPNHNAYISTRKS